MQVLTVDGSLIRLQMDIENIDVTTILDFFDTDKRSSRTWRFEMVFS